MANKTKTSKRGATPNETTEERQLREQAEQVSHELVEEMETTDSDDEVIKARLDETEEEKEERRQKHIGDERALADVGRVREIAASLERDNANYLARLDNAMRRLRGLAGSENPAVADAVAAVAERNGLNVTPAGLTQPKTNYKKGHFLYPFYD